MTTEAQKKAFKKYNEKRKCNRVSLSISKESKNKLDSIREIYTNQLNKNFTYDQLIDILENNIKYFLNNT